MIETQTLKWEQPQYQLRSKTEKCSLNLIQLAKSTIEFYQKVNMIRLNFQGPFYFGLEQNFTDLQIQLIMMAEELNLLQYQSDQARIRIGMNFLEKDNFKNLEIPDNDRDRIAEVVADLGRLIQTIKKSFWETSEVESFFKSRPLEKILRELEHSHWIFSKFSKY